MKAMAVCASCGRAAQIITVPRSSVTPLHVLIGRALVWPLRPAPVAFIITLSVLSFVPLLNWIAYALAWAYFFELVRSTGTGATRFAPTEGLSAGPEDLFKPAFRGVAATGWFWIPAAFYLERRYEFLSGGATIVEIARDPMVWLLPLLGLPSLPIAAMAAATDVSLVDLFNPVFLGRAVFRIGRDYWYCVAAVGAVCLAGALATIVASKLPWAAWAAFALRQVILGYVWLASARLVGSILYLHGHAIGWGDESDYRVPVLGTVPSATTPNPNVSA
jgi:hypothetical protein